MARNYEYYVKHWGELETNLAADPELAFLEPKRAELEKEALGLRQALDKQVAGKVQFHEGTREIEGHVARGNALMVQLHDLIRGYFGREAEMLNKYRLQPRRPRPRPKRRGRQRKSRRSWAPTPLRRPLPRPMARPGK